VADKPTRGPRTPDERATDAARTAATSFEKLPAGPFADDYLKPIATLLRWATTSHADSGLRLRDLRDLEELEQAVLDAVQRFERDCEYMSVRQAVDVGRVIENLRRGLRRSKEQMAAALDEDDGRKA
jgi:hypothetical protein